MDKKKGFNISKLAGLGIGSLFSCVNTAFASTSSGLPWESPLQTVQNSITGPVAITVAIIAMCVSGIALVWGEEISGFVRRILMLVLAISVLVSSSTIITTLFGVSGALI